MPKVQKRRAYREPPVATFTHWSVPRVRGALLLLEQGDFYEAALLADQMLRDDRIAAVLDTRVNGVLGLPVTLDPADGGEKVAAEVERIYWRIFPEDVTRELLRYGLLLGAVPVELVWRTGDRWVPEVRVWHPQFLAWRTDLEAFQVQTADGPLMITPGDGKWALFAHGGARRPWMGALVRRLAIPWLIRQYAWRDWARWSEKHGLPTIKARVPAEASDEDRERFFDSLASLASEGLVELPQDAQGNGFDVELLEAAARDWEGFKDLIEKTDAAISVAVLGQNLTTEVKGGSYAAAKVHEQVRQDYLEADTEVLSTFQREQVLVWFAEFNYGDRELAPWPRFDTEPPADRLGRAQALGQLANAIQVFTEAGVPVDVAALAEEFELPLEGARRLVRLASGDRPSGAKGFVQGQLYADAVADRLVQRAAEAEWKVFEPVMRELEHAQSYDEVRAILLRHFREASPEEIARLAERALLMAELGGRYAVLRDL